MTAKTIITAALTGVLTTRAQSPAIPYTPDEIAEEARRSVEAGASIVHIHARQDDGRPAYDLDTYARIDAAVRARCPDVIINYSTGAVGVSREERVAHIAALRPDLAALNMGSMNYAIYSSKHKTFHHDHVFANPFGDILYFLEAMNAAGTRPEMECFDTGHIHNAAPLIDMGVLQTPYQFSMIMGVLGGIPGTTRHLVQQVDNLPAGAHWQVIGIGARQWPLVAAAISMGGNVRVGLEDNLYLAPRQLAGSNGELVAKAAELVRLVGGEVASVGEARELLELSS
ncbi:MAG: 3-keto-5-aminohexanoate cleavage protein [Candidatus Promineofilum sp.]|nr:3-keto-5-aminohexanoate cleavage protein [Promineifilum sp.]